MVEDSQLRTTGIKVTSAHKIIDDLHKQLTSLLNEDLTSSSLIIKYKWFQTFKISDDAFCSYEYDDFNISTKCKIVKIETIEQKYYDWKHHFQFSITKGNNSNISSIHVVLNECNVFRSFFDPKVPVGIFGDNQLSPVVRLCESLCQNNECPVESIISMFSAQAFRGQHEETAENRAIIKINGDTIADAEDFCRVLAEMSVKGLPEWDIDPLTLPIRYGRYENTIAKSFQTIESQKGKKFSYMYMCKGQDFRNKENQTATGFSKVTVELPRHVDIQD